MSERNPDSGPAWYENAWKRRYAAPTIEPRHFIRGRKFVRLMVGRWSITIGWMGPL